MQRLCFGASLIVAACVWAAEPVGSLPEQEKSRAVLEQLCEAAWAQPPQRFDFLVYRERKLKQLTPDEIRRMVEETLQAADPKGVTAKREREELLQLNVANILNEQKAVRRLVQRVRQEQGRRRVDMAILKPEEAVQDARFSESTFRSAQPTGPEKSQALKVVWHPRLAMIEKSEVPDVSAPTEDWFSPVFKYLIQMRFGRLDESGTLIKSEDNIDAFLGTGRELIKMTTITRGDVPVPVDRVEFVDAATSRPYLVIIAEHDNYRRVYNVKVYDRGTGKLLVERRGGAYLQNDVPTEVELIPYNPDGSVGETDRVFALRADFNAAFASGELDLRVPEGYGLVDARGGSNRALATSQPSAVDASEKVRDILALPGGSIIARNLARAGLARTNIAGGVPASTEPAHEARP